MTQFSDFKPDHLYYIPMGGCGEFGENFNLYTFGGDWIAVDCGVGFADETWPGVDLLLPDPSPLKPYLKNLKGLLITHTHLDHIGAVPYLWRKLRCPVYMTEFAFRFLETALANMDDPPEIPVTIVDPGVPFSLGEFECCYVPITHSVPESSMIEILTEAGRVVHTGDWKLDPNPLVGPAYDPAWFEDIEHDGGVLAVVGDSTNAVVAGHTKSESDVRDGLMQLFPRLKGRIFVSCLSSNVGRVRSVAEAAHASGRRVYLAGWNLIKFEEVARDLGYYQELPRFLKRKEARSMADDELVVICTGSQSEPGAALSKLSLGNHRDFDIQPGDNIVFSARIIPGNEEAIAAMKQRLADLGANIISRENVPECIYASSHPNADELAEIYQILKPEILVGVHGNKEHQEANVAIGLAQGASYGVAPANGDVLDLSQKPPQVVGGWPFKQYALVAGSLVPAADFRHTTGESDAGEA